MSKEQHVKPMSITHTSQLVAHVEAGCKPHTAWAIGTEHEKFPFYVDGLQPVPFDGPRGIEAILQQLIGLGYTPISERGHVIALEHGQASITLEPGGQLELSGAPVRTLHATAEEIRDHLSTLRAVTAPMGIGFLGLGFHPKWDLQHIPHMPKARYEIMRAYMPTRGTLGLDMMHRTCTVQTNLDFASESDMVKKFRVSLALQPIATALFANSPFTLGKPNGFLSYRSHIWTDTDPDRCGTLPFVFEEGMGFERYVDYVLDVPMYFVRRNGQYIHAAGQSFRAFLAGKLPALPGEVPTLEDWADHMTTVFPEVRLKQFLEMRGADVGSEAHLTALPALFVGLLYDPVILDACWDLVATWTANEREQMRYDVPKMALKTPWRHGTLHAVAREVLTMASEGLRRRAQHDAHARDERCYLDPLWETIESGRTPAENMLEAYQTRWHGSVDPAFRELAYA